MSSARGIRIAIPFYYHSSGLAEINAPTNERWRVGTFSAGAPMTEQLLSKLQTESLGLARREKISISGVSRGDIYSLALL